MNKKLLETTNFLLNQIKTNEDGCYYIQLDDGLLYMIDSYSYGTLYNLHQLLQKYEMGEVPIVSSGVNK